MVLFRKITDKLYECLTDDTACQFRVCFGVKTFCSWLLRGEAAHTPDNFPCKCKKDSDQPH